MNIVFWVLTVLMLLAAIVLLVYPLLKVRKKSSIAYKESNLKINEEKIKELDLDLKEGRIDQLFYRAARDELDRELLIDIPAASMENASLHYTNSVTRHPALALMISIFIPLLALLLYLQLGMHSASDASFVAAQQQPQVQAQASQGLPSVEEMARKLEAHIEQNGGTVQEWTLLARAYKYLGNYELAAKAFAVVLEKDKNNVPVMIESAEVMALNNNRSFTPEARALVMHAYELEPDNANVLWFAGVAEYQSGNYQLAIDHLVKLIPLVAGEEDVMKSIISIVTTSREQLIASGKEMPDLESLLGAKVMAAAATPAVEEKATTMPATSAMKRLNVTVDVSAEVREKFDAGDSIFVYAKAKQGPRMPLAVQRMTLSALPATVVLDDSMAMVEGMNLSAFDALVVSARVTKSGSAISQSGDFIGQIDVDDKNTEANINVVIDTLVP
jgi:cytochrome c-type biogenesis protein CcmH